MSDLPKGWMIQEVWVALTYRHELMYQVYVWAKRPVKAHWWSRSKVRTGWFPYGVPCYTYAKAEQLAKMTAENWPGGKHG